jgi:uncharacterized protein (DUF433 family)
MDNWRERIVFNPDILVGKPTVKGTRLSVELVLARLAVDLDLEELFEGYPRLTRADVQACLAYAVDLVEAETDRIFAARGIARDVEL